MVYYNTFNISCTCVWYLETFIPNLVSLDLVMAELTMFTRTNMAKTTKDWLKILIIVYEYVLYKSPLIPYKYFLILYLYCLIIYLY